MQWHLVCRIPWKWLSSGGLNKSYSSIMKLRWWPSLPAVNKLKCFLKSHLYQFPTNTRRELIQFGYHRRLNRLTHSHRTPKAKVEGGERDDGFGPVGGEATYV